MSKLWYPMINQSKCIGCMACYDMCKHGVFTIENDKPKVIYREGCVEGCHRRFQERHQMRLQLRRKGRLTG
jgi:Fe-S-cluster-containing hydrogenase component 2